MTLLSSSVGSPMEPAYTSSLLSAGGPRAGARGHQADPGPLEKTVQGELADGCLPRDTALVDGCHICEDWLP